MPKNSVNFRKNIENALAVAEEERKRKLLEQRLELARNGVIAFNQHRVSDAVRAFHTYIKIVEEIKNVEDGGLMPSYFDKKKEVAELLMLSGVYWDLAKLYDRTSSDEKQREFLHYIEKYIIFAKGMPFQQLCAESLRKYISNEKPVHRQDFKNAYSIISEAKCFVATSLVDVVAPETIPQLRLFRDGVLKTSTLGRFAVAIYYKKGPGWAKRLNQKPYWMRKILGYLLSGLAVILHQITARIRSLS